MRKLLSIVLPSLALCLAVQPAMAAFNLQVTEIWCGNDPGENLSEDWFEVTNLGDMAWTAAVDGNLWFDDSSPNPANAVLMSGILTIGAGESVVYVDGGLLGASDWSDLWDDVVVLPQVGSYEGAGLGQGGDAVALWITAGIPAGAPNELASYPDATSNGGQSYDTVLSAFSTVGNAAGAVATFVVNEELQPAIGSPGPAVPEPGTLTLAAAAALTCLGLRSRKTT